MRTWIRRAGAGALSRGALIALWAAAAGCHQEVLRPPPAQVAVRLIAINDFHGHLEPSLPESLDSTSVGLRSAAAGGAAALAGTVERLRRERPDSLLVAAGDLIGASPLSSALLRDEPAVHVLDRIGLTLTAVGNHEFDDGVAELMRIQHGGCPAGACAAGEPPFAGARYRYLAANVFETVSGRRLFPAYAIRTVAGVRIGFVGAVVQGAPQIIAPESIAGLRFEDEADSINAVVPEILAQGVEAIVVLIHEGAEPDRPVDPASCAGLRGPLLDLNERLHPEVDIVVSGHTHREYICRHRGRLLTQAGSYGHVVTAIDLEIDRRSGEIAASRATNHLVDPAVPSNDPVLQQLLEETRARSAAAAKQPIARLGVPQLPRTIDRNGESVLGRVIADALLHAAHHHRADVACTNPGGVRQHLPGLPTDAPVTFEDAYATQPFGNAVVVLELSGAELRALLEQQWRRGERHGLLSCSRGLSYRFDQARPPGQRVEALQLHGVPVDPQRRYRLAISKFIADGGDAYTVLTRTRRLGEAGSDLEALIAWLRAREPLVPPSDVRAQGRFSDR